MGGGRGLPSLLGSPPPAWKGLVPGDLLQSRRYFKAKKKKFFKSMSRLYQAL